MKARAQHEGYTRAGHKPATLRDSSERLREQYSPKEAAIVPYFYPQLFSYSPLTCVLQMFILPHRRYFSRSVSSPSQSFRKVVWQLPLSERENFCNHRNEGPSIVAKSVTQK